MATKPKLQPGTVTELPLSRLVPDLDQPRKTFDEAALAVLGESLKHRVHVPLLVRPGLRGKYVIHDGERRWRAAKLAKIKTLPVLLVDSKGDGATERASQLTVNNLREQLTPMEIARTLAVLRKDNFASANELAAHLEASGLPPMTVKQINQAIALVDLPDWAQAMIDAGQVEASSLASLKPALEYPKVLDWIGGSMKRRIEWSGRLTRGDVLEAVAHGFDWVGEELSSHRLNYWSNSPIHFNFEKVCKGCEHLVSAGGQKFCMAPEEFERKNAEAKAAGLLPGGKKPDKPVTPKTVEAKAEEEKAAKRAETLGEKARNYLHAYLVQIIVNNMSDGPLLDGVSKIDITDPLLAWDAMKRPGLSYGGYGRAAVSRYEGDAESGIGSLDDLLRATDLDGPKLHAALQVAHELPWRETQVICHELWGPLTAVWEMDEGFVQLFRKAELIHLAETHKLEPPEGKTWQKLKASEIKAAILERADQVREPPILMDIYQDVAKPLERGHSWDRYADEEDEAPEQEEAA